MTTEINWQEPPPSTGGRPAKWAPLAEQLKKRPGKWALVATEATAGSAMGPKRVGLEVTTRFTGRNDDGQPRFDMYARWPSDDTEPSE